MPSFQVIAAQEVRRMPANPEKGWPEKAVDHLTLSGNGVQKLVTMFRKLDEPLPDVGSTIEVELGDPDRYDKDRRKAIRPRQGGGGGPRRRDPTESRRIERQHAQHMALLYIKVKAEKGWIEGFDFADVAKMADAFDRDLDPAPTPLSDIPGDTGGLPTVNEVVDEVLPER